MGALQPKSQSGESRQAFDAVLAARIRDDDIQAFEAIFHVYFEPLRRFAFSYTRSLDAAEDIVQDVMVGTWERRTDFAVQTSVAAYLYRAVRNRAINVLAHDAVVHRHAEEARPTDRMPGADELVFAGELERAVHEKVEALPRRLREVYHLCHDEGLANAEIAEVLGVSTNVVYVRMSRAMKALHHALMPWLDS